MEQIGLLVQLEAYIPEIFFRNLGLTLAEDNRT
jgi:hypothetical protein